MELIENPGPAPFGADDPASRGPMPGSLLPCGCYVRRPDYEAVLCADHLVELNGCP